jgi:hypothetical protein
MSVSREALTAVETMAALYLTLSGPDGPDEFLDNVNTTVLQSAEDLLRDMIYLAYPDCDPDEVIRTWLDLGQSVAEAAAFVRGTAWPWRTPDRGIQHVVSAAAQGI